MRVWRWKNILYDLLKIIYIMIDAFDAYEVRYLHFIIMKITNGAMVNYSENSYEQKTRKLGIHCSIVAMVNYPPSVLLIFYLKIIVCPITRFVLQNQCSILVARWKFAAVGHGNHGIAQLLGPVNTTFSLGWKNKIDLNHVHKIHIQ